MRHKNNPEEYLTEKEVIEKYGIPKSLLTRLSNRQEGIPIKHSSSHPAKMAKLRFDIMEDEKGGLFKRFYKEHVDAILNSYCIVPHGKYYRCYFDESKEADIKRLQRIASTSAFGKRIAYEKKRKEAVSDCRKKATQKLTPEKKIYLRELSEELRKDIAKDASFATKTLKSYIHQDKFSQALKILKENPKAANNEAWKLALSNANLPLIEKFIKIGFDPHKDIEIIDEEGTRFQFSIWKSPLSFFINKNSFYNSGDGKKALEILKKLTTKATINKETRVTGLAENSRYRAEGYEGMTPLHYAVSDARQDKEIAKIVEFLLKNGAEPNTWVKYIYHGKETPLIAAARRGFAETVEVLLKNGAKKINTTALATARREFNKLAGRAHWKDEERDKYGKIIELLEAKSVEASRPISEPKAKKKISAPQKKEELARKFFRPTTSESAKIKELVKEGLSAKAAIEFLEARRLESAKPVKTRTPTEAEKKQIAQMVANGFSVEQATGIIMGVSEQRK